MPLQISSIFVDFRLETFPTEDEVTKLVVEPIEKLTKTNFSRLVTGTKGKSTVCLESKEGEDFDIFVLVRIYDRKNENEKVLLTLTVELPGDVEKVITNYTDMDLEDTLKTALENNFNNSKVTLYPTIKRCIPNSPYLRTSDDRLLEYGFKETLYSKQSPYQLVEIVDTVDFGRLLILDGMTNLAESDTVAYTHSLMNIPSEDYGGKEVLILGGGDGALIKELFDLKNPPAYVTMVDIDDAVMDGCNEFMPNVCGNFLDRRNRVGKNYEIITGCAIEFMKKALNSNKKFDYIFGDLTDTPVSEDRDSNIWDFLKTIITMGVKLLKPNIGKYMTHCNGKNVPNSIKAYEKMLLSLEGGNCTFERGEKFVPSFLETWMYYRITRHESKN